MSAEYLLTALIVCLAPGLGVVCTPSTMPGGGLGAARTRRAVLSSPIVLAWLRRALAAAFAGLGLKLALERA